MNRQIELTSTGRFRLHVSAGAAENRLPFAAFFAKFEQALANGGNTFYVTPRDAASAFHVRL